MNLVSFAAFYHLFALPNHFRYIIDMFLDIIRQSLDTGISGQEFISYLLRWVNVCCLLEIWVTNQVLPLGKTNRWYLFRSWADNASFHFFYYWMDDNNAENHWATFKATIEDADASLWHCIYIILPCHRSVVNLQVILTKGWLAKRLPAS